MLPQINITNADIEFAEKILLPSGFHFDDERREFIKKLETIDLQAVPGSGKTTALLAKLIILDKYLPFQDGSGVLVISHTNTAINEIRERIGKYCPNLFKYPNFVGTIHSFVNQFLCIPFYENTFYKKITLVDDLAYQKAHKKPNPKTKYYLDQRFISLETNCRLFNSNIYKSGDISKEIFKDKTRPTFNDVLSIKQDLRERGYLCYDDVFLLGFEYLLEQPKIVALIRNRFKMVFVDEFQDMHNLQYSILEELFSSEDIVYQRIGDRNQSIYSRNTNQEIEYPERDTTLRLNTSHRLPENIASIVEPFGKSHIQIVSNRTTLDKKIKPCLIVYNDEKIEEVIPYFASQINQLITEDKIATSDNNKYYAIGWNTRSKENKIGVDKYFPGFMRNTAKEEMVCLRDYIYKRNSNREYNQYRKNIINSLLKILRIEDIKDENGKFYNYYSVIKKVREHDEEKYDQFKLKIAEIVFRIQKKEFEEAYNQLLEYLPEFLTLFEGLIDKSKEFIEVSTQVQDINEDYINTFNDGNINIKIGSVHSIKGQTHTATLYLETSYQGKYESERNHKQLLGENFNDARIYSKQSTKMMYVGFSRPTDYLCFAVHKNNYDKYLSGLISNKIWDIVIL